MLRPTVQVRDQHPHTNECVHVGRPINDAVPAATEVIETGPQHDRCCQRQF